MSYHIRWNDDTQTIVRQVYEGRVGRTDFEGMVCASAQLLETVPHKVDIILEWQGERHMLNDISIVYGAMFAEKRVPTNQRFVFAINAPIMFRVLLQALQRATPRIVNSLYFVDTVDAAYRLRAILLDMETSSV
jgi:hypothetical protein